MSSSGATTSSGGNVFKNIAVGVITTVIGAAAIYFLGFHESGNESKKERKEATETGWKTYRENLKIYSDVLNSLNKNSEDISKRKQEISHEIESTVSSLQNILTDTKIDTRLKNLIELRIPQLTDGKRIVESYFDSLMVFSASNPTDEEGYAFLNRIVPRLKTEMNEAKKRDSLRIRRYTDELKKEYDLED